MKNKIKRAIFHPSHLALFILHKTAGFWPDKLYLKLKFRLVMGHKLDLKSPKTFNEKLQWLKLYNRCPEYSMMVDKFAVKDYVSRIICEEYIIPTIAIYNKIEDIEWEKLPNQFVLKTTHGGGGGGVVICKNKSCFNKLDAINILRKSLENDIYKYYCEWPYKDVSKRILVEEYIEDDDLKDYKFFCFNGYAKFLKIDFNRFKNHQANYYDLNMNILPFGELCCLPDYTRTFDKPQNFETMIDIVNRLSKDIPFSRIDLYNVRGQIYFGEITFYPAGGMGRFEPDIWDLKLGDMLDLPNK